MLVITPQPTVAFQQGVTKQIGVLKTANLNVTTDQAIAMLFTAGKFLVTGIYITNASGVPTTAAGGIYTAASKAGTALIAAGQVYSALTSATVVLIPTIAANLTLAASPIYFSLTTAQGSAMTADIYVYGLELS